MSEVLSQDRVRALVLAAKEEADAIRGDFETTTRLNQMIDELAACALSQSPPPPVIQEAEPDLDPEGLAKMQASNEWHHLNDVMEVLRRMRAGTWRWYANTRCKYIELRIDTRDLGCIIRDRKGVRISLKTLAHQQREVPVQTQPAIPLSTVKKMLAQLNEWSLAQQAGPEECAGIHNQPVAPIINPLLHHVMAQTEQMLGAMRSVPDSGVVTSVPDCPICGDNDKVRIGEDGRWRCDRCHDKEAPADSEESLSREVSRLKAEAQELRIRWCIAYAGAAAYTDDGQAQDSRQFPTIDFLTDTLQQIEQKMRQRASGQITSTISKASVLQNAVFTLRNLLLQVVQEQLGRVLNVHKVFNEPRVSTQMDWILSELRKLDRS